MAMSMIDKYRKILDADPASMVFVELAKALLDQGQLDQAIETCKKGLAHHPDSIVGHVLWGRALIDLGRPDEAMDEFDKAMALDPDNPYAYNLIGEALLHRRLYRSALPVLQRAVSLQPGDRRVRQWLAQAERAVGDGSADGGGFVIDPTIADNATVPGSVLEQSDASDVNAPPDPDATEVAVDALKPATGEPDRFPWESSPADADETQLVSSLSSEGDYGEDEPGMPPPEPEPPQGDEAWPGMPPSEPEPPQEDEAWPDVPSSAEGGAEEDEEVLAGMTATFQALEQRNEDDPYPSLETPKVIASPEVQDEEPAWDEDAEGIGEARAGFVGREWDAPPDPEDEPEPQSSYAEDTPPESAPFPAPPPLPPEQSSADQQDQVLEVFGLELPPAPGKEPSIRRQESEPEEEEEPEEDPGVAAALAAEYERELREEMIVPEDDAQKSRKWRRIATVGGGVLVVATAVIAFVWVTITGREEAVRTGLDSARNGIARDTFAGYLAALERLDDVLRIDGSNAEGRALAAAAEAIVFSELDPDPSRRARAESMLDDPEIAAEIETRHPDLLLDTRYHLADEEKRGEIGEEVLAALEARDDSAILHYLAGRHHLAAGDTEKATEHFAKVLEIQPGHARTVLALGNHFASLERWEDALTYFENVRTNYPGHGRAEVGAAEARLALDREVDEALSSILELEREHQESLSAFERLHLQLIAARLQHHTGETDAAITRLRSAMASHPQSPALPLLLAEILLERNELPAALEAAEKAEELDAEDTSIRRVKARVLLAWSRYEEAAETLESIEEPDRRTWLERAIVAYHAGDYRAARQALDNTRNPEGRMLADAAIYLALVDLMTDEPRAARTVLNRAAQARGADLLVEWSLGRWHLEQGNPRPAATHLGNAIDEEPRHFRAHADLASLQIRAGAHDQALVHLTEALEVNPYFREALQMLGDCHLALGEPGPARDAFQRVLKHHPEDPAAHQGLAFAFIELGEIEKAMAHATAAVEHGRAMAASHHALGLVLLAKEETQQAIAALVQARRRDPDDPDILADLALAHMKRGRPADRRHARRYLDQALEKDGRHATSHWRLGKVYFEQRDARNSIQSLNRAVAQLRRDGDNDRLAAATIDLSRAHVLGGGQRGLRRARQAAIESVRARDSAEGRKQLALVYIEEGRPVLARQQLEQAVALDPDHAMAQFNLGRILAEAGENEAAKAALEKALSLAPRGGHVREARRLIASVSD